jgi:pimeloyl-ACP methyl ester carboxylesterase
LAFGMKPFRPLAAVLLLHIGASAAQATEATPIVKGVALGDGITLHYLEAGHGTPVIFVHGSISDYSYWQGPFAALATHYHVFAYSRRYNYPNTNPSRPGYSASTDADDLAAFVEKLHLGRVYVVGHSYGALTALFLLVNHPGTVRAVVLAEPPAVSLLNHLQADRAALGAAMFADIQTRMVQPMRAAFAKGDAESGVRIFIDYVKDDPTAWARMSASSKAETMRDAHEWEVMMTSGEFFPAIEPDAIGKIHVPVLLLSGEKSYPFLNLTDEALLHLIPGSERIVLHGATHQMLYDQPAICEDEILAFLHRNDVE